jgi:hypothetical protein
MDRDLMIRRKWTLRAHGKQIVLVKRVNEQNSHVIMKAFLWALYLPVYPEINVEVSIGDRYKPDLVALDNQGRPTFWGEAGQLSVEKIRSLLRRHRGTHFAIAKWKVPLSPFLQIVKNILADIKRESPLDLIRFPVDSVTRYIDERGEIHIGHDMLEWIRIPQPFPSLRRLSPKHIDLMATRLPLGLESRPLPGCQCKK